MNTALNLKDLSFADAKDQMVLIANAIYNNQNISWLEVANKFSHSDAESIVIKADMIRLIMSEMCIESDAPNRYILYIPCDIQNIIKRCMIKFMHIKKGDIEVPTHISIKRRYDDWNGGEFAITLSKIYSCDIHHNASGYRVSTNEEVDMKNISFFDVEEGALIAATDAAIKSTSEFYLTGMSYSR